jgi:hypothetical protein
MHDTPLGVSVNGCNLNIQLFEMFNSFCAIFPGGDDR